jgi:NADH dehydrogenase FAD-containing subunit
VEVIVSTKVTSQSPLASGRTELKLSDGTTITTSLYLPTNGVVPNSSYIPTHLLTASGFVVVDEYLRVKDAKDVWAMGDVSSLELPTYKNAVKQAPHLARNIELSLNGGALIPYKIDEKGMISRTHYKPVFRRTLLILIM